MSIVEVAFVNLNAFVFGKYKNSDLDSRIELWNRTPESTKEKVRDFCLRSPEFEKPK